MYRRTMKMKPIDLMSNTYIDFKIGNKDKYPKFGVDGYVRISKYKITFAKVYTSNCSQNVFEINKVKNTVLWIYIIKDLHQTEIIWTFDEKQLQKTKQSAFSVGKK